MPRGGPGRGGKRSHKGRNRHFTSVEELKEQSKKAEKEKEWRRQQGIPSDDSDEDEETAEGAVAKKTAGSDSDSDSSGDAEEEKNKGVGHLIQIQNPNRTDANRLRKVTNLQTTEGPELSRKEREEIQKQQAAAYYRKLHNEGKTDEARADLARLQIIRKQREEAAKKKAEEQSKKDATTQAAEKKLLDRKSGKK